MDFERLKDKVKHIEDMNKDIFYPNVIDKSTIIGYYRKTYALQNVNKIIAFK